MTRHSLTALGLCLLLSACAPAPVASPTLTPPPTAAPAVTAAPPTAMPVPAPSPDPRLQRPDLSAFAAAWSSGDAAAIRALYTQDATCLSAADAVALRRGEAISGRVADALFTQRAQEYSGLRLRILGDAVGIMSKVAGFAFRWENEREGYSGVALLRYEGEHIFLHFYAVNSAPTPNQGRDSDYFQPASLETWTAAWRSGAGVAAAQSLYTEEAAILADEDLVQAPWRDFQRPPSVVSAIREYSQWNAVAGSEAVRSGDLVWFVWHWQAFDFPLGYGVRVLRYDGQKIDLDIRFAVRPWEPEGKTFMNP